MKGPYIAHVYLNRAPAGEADLELHFEEMYYADGKGEARVEAYPGGFMTSPVSTAAKAVSQFYRDGASGTLAGMERLATFYVGALLEDGERAVIVLHGTHGGNPAIAGGSSVRRANGALISTLGSKWGRERKFLGC